MQLAQKVDLFALEQTFKVLQQICDMGLFLQVDVTGVKKTQVAHMWFNAALEQVRIVVEDKRESGLEKRVQKGSFSVRG